MEGLSPYDSKKAVGILRILSQQALNAVSCSVSNYILAPTWLPLNNLQPLAQECSYVPSTDRGVPVTGHGALSCRTREVLGVPHSWQSSECWGKCLVFVAPGT